MALFIIQTGVSVEGMIFESSCPQGATQGAQISEKPPTHDVERFLSMLRFDSKDKVNALGCYVELEASKSDI